MTLDDPDFNILTTLRSEMKKRGYGYRHLALVLRVSLPTVKRIFSRNDISLQQLTKACRWLELDLSEVVSTSSSQAKHVVHRFSREQESYFAEHPEYLAYFDALYTQELVAAEIQVKHRLSAKSTQRYLHRLEKLKLIKVLPKNEVKFLIKGALAWERDSKLGKMLSQTLMTQLYQNAKAGESKNLYTRINTWGLTTAQYEQLQWDYEEWIGKYRQLARLNRLDPDKKKMTTISMVTIADSCDDPLYARIPEPH